MSETTTDDRTDRSTEANNDTIDTGAMKAVSGIVALVGLWIAVSPLVFESTEAGLWNNLIVGAAVLLLAGYNYYRLASDQLASVGIASLVALLGLWAIASPFVIEMGSDTLLWSTVISGAIVAILSGYNAYANQNADVPARADTRA